MGGGIVNNPMADHGGAAVADPSSSGSGGTGNGSTKITYSYSRERFAINATNMFVVDYYPQYTVKTLQPRDIATFAVNFAPTKSTNITVGQGFKDLPEFAFSDLMDPALVDGLPLNHVPGITAERYRRYGTTLDVGQKLTRRTSASLSLGYGRGMITTGHNWTTVLYAGNISHMITKGVSIYAGYAHGEQREKGGTDSHPTMTGGVDFNRALSISRRTTLGFSTGVSEVYDRSQDQKHYYLIGSVGLKREFGRTWETALYAGRNVRRVETLSTPLLSDTFSVVLNGSFSRRIQLKSSFGQSIGRVPVTGGTGYDTLYGSAALSVALTRQLALATDYTLYRYTFDGDALTAAAAGQMNRSGVRTYLQLWLPLISRTKRPQ